MAHGHTIILASSSPYRRAILERVGIEFLQCAPEIDETPMPDESPDNIVIRLSAAKASAVADRHFGSLIIGSDQLAVLNGQIIGKPVNHEDAVKQLKAASGRCTILHSGISLLNSTTGQIQSAVDHVEVECRTLNEDEINRYLTLDKPYDCCGSLKVEGRGISLLRRVRSDDPNAIIGFSLIRLISMLRNEGIFLP